MIQKKHSGSVRYIFGVVSLPRCVGENLSTVKNEKNRAIQSGPKLSSLRSEHLGASLD